MLPNLLHVFDIWTVYNWIDCGAASSSTFVRDLDFVQPTKLWCCQFIYICLISGLCTTNKTVVLPVLLHVFATWTEYNQQDCGAASPSICVWYLDCEQPTRLWCCQVFYMCLISRLCTTNKTVVLQVLLPVVDIWTVYNQQNCGAANSSTYVWYLDCVQPTKLWCCQFFYMCLLPGLSTTNKTVVLPVLLYVFDIWTVNNRQDCGAAKSSTCVWYLDCEQPTRLWCCQVFYTCLISWLWTTDKTVVLPSLLHVFDIWTVNNRQDYGAAKSSTCVWYLDCEQPTRLWCCQVFYTCLISGLWTTDKTMVLPSLLHVFDIWTVNNRQDYGAAKSSTCVWYLDCEQPTRLWCCQVFYTCLISGLWTTDKTMVLPSLLHVFDIWTVNNRQDYGAAKSSTCVWYLDCEQPTRLWCCQVFYTCLISGLWTTDKTMVLPSLLHVFDIWTVNNRQDYGAAKSSTCVWYLDCEQPTRLWCCQVFYMCLISRLWTTDKTVVLPSLLHVLDILTVNNRQDCGAAKSSKCIWYLDCE